MMRYRKGDGERSSLFTRRALLLGGAQAVLLSALAGRLYQLQVDDTERFSTLAEENRINLRLLPPSRGLIFDRSGRPLAVNRNNFRAMATSDRGRGVELLVDRLDLKWRGWSSTRPTCPACSSISARRAITPKAS